MHEPILTDHPRTVDGRAAQIVTLRDIARVANVSVSTASRALAGTGLVNRRTEGRILKIAQGLGYRPNALARGLATQSSNLVGLMLHNLLNASFQRIAEIAQARLAEANYQMLLCISGDNVGQEAAYLSTLFDHRVEGLLVIPTGENGPLIERFQRAGTAVVGMVRSGPNPAHDTVLPDDNEGAYEGTKYLLGLGHRRIGLIVGREETTSGRERLSGYFRALLEYGVDPAISSNYVRQVSYRPEAGREAATALLDLPVQPTALFSANHEASFGVIRVLSERGIAVPEDLSLLCYEDVAWFSWHRPPISVVDSGAEALANLALDLLLQQIGPGKHAPAQAPGRVLRVGARLVVRGSCQPPRLV